MEKKLENSEKIDKDSRWKTVLLNALVLLFAIGVAWNSSVWLASLWVALVIAVCVLCYVPIKTKYKKITGIILSVIAGGVLVIYYVKTQPTINVLGVTYSRINTQSYYYNGSDRNHRDVVIYTLMKDKTAVIPSAEEWYGEYIEMFSKALIVDSSITDMIDIQNEELCQVGNMAIFVYSDLFDEKTYKNLSERNEFPQLYVSTSNWESTEKIIVLGDDEQNLYLIPME